MSHSAGVGAHRGGHAPQWDKDWDCDKPGHNGHRGEGHDKCDKNESPLLAMLELLAVQQAQQAQYQADQLREDAIRESHRDPEPTPEQLQDLRDRLGLPPLPAWLQMLIDDKALRRA